MNEKRRLIYPVWKQDAPQREERLAFIKISGIATLSFFCSGIFVLWGISDSFNLVLMSIGLGGLLVTYIWFMFRLRRFTQKPKM